MEPDLFPSTLTSMQTLLAEDHLLEGLSLLEEQIFNTEKELEDQQFPKQRTEFGAKMNWIRKSYHDNTSSCIICAI
jgi:hypothetical protein